MKFVLMTADRKLYTASQQQLDKLSVTYFKGWHCTLGHNNIDISSKGEFRQSGCGNSGTTCQQPMCFRAQDMSIPKAQDQTTLMEFKTLVANVEIKSLPQYQPDAGSPVAMMSDFHQSDSLMVDWMLHVRCNYECRYCPDDLHSMVDDYSDIQQHQQTFLKLPPAQSTRMQLYGGEPTLWKPLPEFLEWCHQQRKIQIRIMTNGSANVDRLIALHKHAQLIVSMHDEYVTPKLLTRWLDFLQQTPYKNRVVFKMFTQRPDYLEFLKTASLYDFARSSTYKLVDKEKLTWWDTANNQ
jgi:uncharacterized radical SAM superfamily Fe-S cluster-containing enzyme